MRMSGLSKVEMSAFIGGRGRHGNGANRLEPTRTGPATCVARDKAKADHAEGSCQPTKISDSLPICRKPSLLAAVFQSRICTRNHPTPPVRGEVFLRIPARSELGFEKQQFGIGVSYTDTRPPPLPTSRALGNCARITGNPEVIHGVLLLRQAPRWALVCAIVAIAASFRFGREFFENDRSVRCGSLSLKTETIPLGRRAGHERRSSTSRLMAERRGVSLRLLYRAKTGNRNRMPDSHPPEEMGLPQGATPLQEKGRPEGRPFC